MPSSKLSDAELMKILKIDSATFAMFKNVRDSAMKEAKLLQSRKNKKPKILGISGSARDEFDMAQETSNSEELLKRCLSECRKLGAETELIQLRKYDIRHCKACYSTANTQCHCPCSCYQKGTKLADDMSNILYDKILAADAIVFATPVNNYSMSTLMKTFIDRTISLDGSLRPADSKQPKNKELNVKHMKFIEKTADNSVPGSGILKRFAGKTAGIIVTGHEEGASMVISSLYMYLNGCGMSFPPFSYVYAISSICNSTYEDKQIVTGRCYDEDLCLLAKNVLQGVRLARQCKPADWSYDYKKN